jgi:hypothetical protein
VPIDLFTETTGAEGARAGPGRSSGEAWAGRAAEAEICAPGADARADGCGDGAGEAVGRTSPPSERAASAFAFGACEDPAATRVAGRTVAATIGAASSDPVNPLPFAGEGLGEGRPCEARGALGRKVVPLSLTLSPLSRGEGTGFGSGRRGAGAADPNSSFFRGGPPAGMVTGMVTGVADGSPRSGTSPFDTVNTLLLAPLALGESKPCETPCPPVDEVLSLSLRSRGEGTGFGSGLRSAVRGESTAGAVIRAPGSTVGITTARDWAAVRIGAGLAAVCRTLVGAAPSAGTGGGATTTVVEGGANDEVVAIGAAVTSGAALLGAPGAKEDSAAGVPVATGDEWLERDATGAGVATAFGPLGAAATGIATVACDE